MVSRRAYRSPLGRVMSRQLCECLIVFLVFIIGLYPISQKLSIIKLDLFYIAWYFGHALKGTRFAPKRHCGLGGYRLGVPPVLPVGGNLEALRVPSIPIIPDRRKLANKADCILSIVCNDFPLRPAYHVVYYMDRKSVWYIIYGLYTFDCMQSFDIYWILWMYTMFNISYDRECIQSPAHKSV